MNLVYSQERSYAKDKFEREENIEKEGVNADEVYMNDVLKRCSDGSKILDIGTGTGRIPLHVVQRTGIAIEVIALDLSKDMVRIARKNTSKQRNVNIVRADVHSLPFKDESLDVVMSKLTPHDIDEASRTLRPGGWYILQMSGLFDCWSEIETIFGDRAYSLVWHHHAEYKSSWERLEWLKSSGFTDVQEKDFIVRHYYELNQLIRQMEFDPIVKGFDKKKDLALLKELQKKFSTEKGIQITKYPLIIIGRKKTT